MTATTGAVSRPAADADHRPITFRWRSGALLLLTSIVGFVAFTWPLFTSASGDEDLAHAGDAPFLFLVLLPLLLAVLLVELSDGRLDAKAVAILGVLVACGAALRAPTLGAAGFTGVFFLLLPGGRVFGRGFGFVQGALTMFASGLLTGGVGPWLPFQMVGAAWVGFGAGCLPRARGRAELAVLAAYGALSGLLYGALLNMWFWPFAVSPGADVQFRPGASVLTNLERFWAFHVATSFGYDLPRALGNVLLVVFAGTPVLAALRRAARRAAFGAVPTFDPRP